MDKNQSQKSKQQRNKTTTQKKKKNVPKRDNKPKYGPGFAPRSKYEASTKVLKKEEAVQIFAPNSTNINLKESIAVEAIFDQTALNLAYASLYSFLCSKGLLLLSAEDGNDPQVIVGGLGYLFQAFTQSINSGTMTVTRAPEVVLDMFAALKSKNINFCTYGKLIFSWLDAPTWSNNPIINAAGGTWQPLVVQADTGDYDSPASVPSAIYTEQNYSAFLSKITGLIQSGKMAIRDVATYKSVLVKDVSSYARNYVYNGLSPSPAGGYYKDVENEVTITAPMLSAFAKYSQSQAFEGRVPTKLHAYGGDAALSMGWPLHPSFNSYFNKRPPAFKCIDFEWIYTMLGFWICEAITSQTGAGSFLIGNTLGMTKQDFRIILRQALLNVFDSQYMVQFTGPLSFAQNDNGFVPFQVNGNSYGAPIFSTMLVPELLQENLNALKARCIRTNNKGKSQINLQTYIPILGRYEADNDIEFQYQVGDEFYPLFDTTPQAPINLTNGQINQNEYVNLNSSYYQTCLSYWTDAVGRLKNIMASTTSIVGDHGPMGLGVLYYTSVVHTTPQDTLAAVTAKAAKHLRSPFVKNVINDGTKTVEIEVATKNALVRQSSKKEVKALPPATLLTATQSYTTAAVPVGSEMQAFLDSIIVPVIRLDPNGNADQLSLQMYQIETKEVVSAKSLAALNTGGGGLLSRLAKYAILCLTGLAHDSGGEYDRILQQLKGHNDAGMLAGILGGLAKTFLPPDAHGIVDTVADILPF